MVQICETTSDLTSSIGYLKSFSRQLLKTQLFIGVFQEKRFVSALDDYRDVIQIDAEEKQFIDNLLVVMKKIKSFYRNINVNQWIGFTDSSIIGAPSGNNLWVSLPNEVAFGKYWFKVKAVQFFDKEVVLKLDIVRQCKTENSFAEVLESLDSKKLTDFDPKIVVQQVLNSFKSNLSIFYKDYLNTTNIKESIIFIFFLISSIVIAGTHMICYLLEFTLKLMRELSNFLHVSAPIIITFINIIGRFIFGIFGFIFMLCVNRRTPQYSQVYNLYNMNPNVLPAYTPPKRLAIKPARFTRLY